MLPDAELTYLDHAATSPLRPEARAAMEPWLGTHLGNPSGAHAAARRARRAIDDARDAVADVLGAKPGEVVFTSGGTEADNLAIAGAVAAAPASATAPSSALCSAIEHPAVLESVRRVGGTTVAVDRHGRLDLDQLAEAVGAKTAVVSVMAVNNEVGVIQPIAEVVDVVREAAPEALIHTDAVQAAPWLDVAALATGTDLISISAHKFGGPQGVGALVVRGGAALAPLLVGGGQERERRSGTPNVAGIVGMAAALEATVTDRKAIVEEVGRLRDRLADGLAAISDAIESGVEGGDRSHKIAGSCHFCFAGVESDALLFLLDQAGVAASAASSCASGALEPSHVLAAMGVDRRLAAGSLRLSLGWSSTDADVDRVLRIVPDAVARLREDR